MAAHKAEAFVNNHDLGVSGGLAGIEAHRDSGPLQLAGGALVLLVDLLVITGILQQDPHRHPPLAGRDQVLDQLVGPVFLRARGLEEKHGDIHPAGGVLQKARQRRVVFLVGQHDDLPRRGADLLPDPGARRSRPPAAGAGEGEVGADGLEGALAHRRAVKELFDIVEGPVPVAEADNGAGPFFADKGELLELLGRGGVEVDPLPGPGRRHGEESEEQADGGETGPQAAAGGDHFLTGHHGTSMRRMILKPPPRTRELVLPMLSRKTWISDERVPASQMMIRVLSAGISSWRARTST